MKKTHLVLPAILLVLSLAGCGQKTQTSPASQTTDGIVAEDGYGEGRLGDVMHTYFFDYTVNSAYTCSEFEGYAPQDGNQLLVAEVTVKNTDNASIEMYDTDFQAQWGGDEEDDYDVPITYYVDPVSEEQLPGVYELGINEERTGLLVFEVPEDMKDFSISYMESFSDDSEGDTFFVFFTATAKE